MKRIKFSTQRVAQTILVAMFLLVPTLTVGADGFDLRGYDQIRTLDDWCSRC